MMAEPIGAAIMAGGSRAAAIQQQQLLQQQMPPSLFDLFYEELLTDLIKSGDLEERVPREFMQLQSDIERIEYLMSLRPSVANYEVKSRIGLKSAEKSLKYREEGNRLFQADQTAQAILFYNKSLVHAPHPDYEEYTWPLEMDGDKNKRKDSKGSDSKPGKYEALALCYANRSAALRKLCQYEDCLRDIARAARFGYPKENMFKLWERKAKCYQGIRRFDMAAKCLRQALQVLKDSTLTEGQKASKTTEYQNLLKEVTNAQFIMQMGSPVAEDGELSPSPPPQLMGNTGPMVLIQEPVPKKRTTSECEKPSVANSTGPPQLMGNTGPLVFIQEPTPKKKTEPVAATNSTSPPQLMGNTGPMVLIQEPTPKKKSNAESAVKQNVQSPPQLMGNTGPMVLTPEPVSKKKSIVENDKPAVIDPSQLMGNTGPMVLVPEAVPKKRTTSESKEAPAVNPPKPEKKGFFSKKSTASEAPKPIGGSYQSQSKPASEKISVSGQGSNSSASSTAGGAAIGGNGSISGGSQASSPIGAGELHKATSQISITQLSGINVNIRPDQEVPELSYGVNPRMPSASIAIDLRFAPDKGRFFVATQDLVPGDVILREEPYAAVLEPIFRVNHCSHCLRKISTPIPCFECATVQYCCETCRDAGWTEYHRIECGVLGYLEPSRYLGKMPHLALRIITRTGLQNLIQHSLVNTAGGGNPGVKNGSKTEASQPQTIMAARQNIGDQSSMFDPTSYRSVHNLATNTDKRSFEDLIKKTTEAIFMAKCLKFNGFFGDSKDEKSRRGEIFIASLLLRHIQIAATNGLEMAECILKNNDITKFDIIPVGGAIFPTMSFFNHSCYPNSLRLGYQSNQVVRVIRTIRRGEEVTIDYGFDFYANRIDARQKRAQNQYHFACKCVACVNNWPTYNDLVGQERGLKVAPNQAMMEEMNRQTSNYQLAMDYLVRLDISTAMPMFREYLMVMNELVCHPDQSYIDCEEAYKQCLWLENRGFKSKPIPSNEVMPKSQLSLSSFGLMGR